MCVLLRRQICLFLNATCAARAVCALQACSNFLPQELISKSNGKELHTKEAGAVWSSRNLDFGRWEEKGSFKCLRKH